MKIILRVALILVILCIGIGCWIFLGPATGFQGERKALYIRSDAANKKAILDSLEANHLINNTTAFSFLADRMNYWKNIRPGKYEISKGASLLSIVRMLRNGRQTPVNLVILPRLRTKEDLAELVGKKFECDSMQMVSFLNSADSLQVFDTDPEVSMWRMIPDTYTFYWNTSPSEIYRKIFNESKKFWTPERTQAAAALNITPLQAYTLASIVEEETTKNAEKDTIASVYLNRYRTGMPLQADPTLKFATRQFSLKVIRGAILDVESPYNTYKNKGFPPGPICVPSKSSIDAALHPAQTDYLFFVANSKLNGHLFSSTFEEHRLKAQQYRAEDKLRQEKEQTKK